VNGVLGNIPAINGLLTITLTRGANVDVAGPDAQHAAASIVTLEANVAIDCSKVPALSTIQSLAGSVPLVNLSLCSAAAQGGAAPGQTAHATSAPAGSTSLADVQLGQADAAVTLTPCVTGDAVCPVTPVRARIPNTGNNMLILAAFGLILAAAGIAINRRRLPVRG
jgi:LPXTG-motif cell wall-anchored protein